MINYAFIHIPKNGGTSIKKAIDNNNITNMKYFYHSVIFDNIPKTHNEIIIIREPLDRFTSAFFYAKNFLIRKTKFNNPDEFVYGITNLDTEALKLLRPQRKKHSINRKVIATDFIFHQQTSWVNNPYKIIFHDKIQEGFNNLGFDIKIPHVNKTTNKVDFEYSQRSLKFIFNMYKKDFKFYEEQRGKI